MHLKKEQRQQLKLYQLHQRHQQHMQNVKDVMEQMVKQKHLVSQQYLQDKTKQHLLSYE